MDTSLTLSYSDEAQRWASSVLSAAQVLVCLTRFCVASQGKLFYLTPGVCPSLGTMKAILESAGGKLLSKQPSYRKIMEHQQNKVLIPVREEQ